MSASQDPRAEWLDGEFWERLGRLEGRHRRLQSDHDNARRELERLLPHEADEMRRAWRRYCEVIAELEQATAEFEALRRWADSTVDSGARACCHAGLWRS